MFLVGLRCPLWVVGALGGALGQPRGTGILADGGGRRVAMMEDPRVQPGCCPWPRNWASSCNRKKAANQRGQLGSHSGFSWLWPELLPGVGWPRWLPSDAASQAPILNRSHGSCPGPTLPA